MMKKLMKKGAVLGAAVLLLSACLGQESSTSTYDANILSHYEPDNSYEYDDFLNTLFNGGKDTVSVNKYLTLGPLTHYSTVKDADGSLVGGFALCVGKDTLATPERKPSRFAVFDKGGYKESLAYVVFHDTTAALMPEHAMQFYVPNTASSCEPKAVCVQNVQAVVQAVKHGTGLAGGPFTSDDYLTLVLTGSLKGKVQATVEVTLVDGTKPLDKWTEVDLTRMGKADVIDLHLESSRPDLPLYCCLDNLLFHYSEIYN